MNKTLINSKFPPCLEIVLLYLKLRKEGNTLNKEEVCDYCYVSPEVFNETVHCLEDVFPEYRYHFIKLVYL